MDYFVVDGVSSIFAGLALLVGALCLLYSKWYIHEERPKYYGLMIMFIVSMAGLVIANDSILLVLFWEMTAICSYGLIGIKGTESASKSAGKALIITQLGAAALITALAMGWAAGATTLPAAIALGSPVILALLCVAALTKSAVFPFHSWLPSAMEAPTPVSALLHSAAMVMAGVYLVARMAVALSTQPLISDAVIVLAAVSIIYASVMAFFQTDLKRLLAYSTIANIGMMFIAMLYGPIAMAAGLLHVISHAFFKAALFLEAGVLEREYGTKNYQHIRGVISSMPLTAIAIVLAALSATGVPLTLGFASKWAMYTNVPLVAFVLMFGTMSGLVYYANFLGNILFGRTGKGTDRLVPLLAIVPMVLVTFAGVFPQPFEAIAAAAASAAYGVPVSLASIPIALPILLVVAVIGALLFTNTYPETFTGGEPAPEVGEYTPTQQLREEAKLMAVDTDLIFMKQWGSLLQSLGFAADAERHIEKSPLLWVVFAVALSAAAMVVL